MNTALYIHIPFCKKRCLYCDFYSTIHDEGVAASYIDVLTKEVAALSENFYTIYIGGGTPTILDKKLLSKLLDSLNRFSKNAAEFTVEANPESLDKDKAKLLVDAGVSRISIGAQSFDNRKLAKLGRLHDSKKAKEAIDTAIRAGFKNISIDMIFGLWDEEMDSWERELKVAARAPVQHISCYSLSYEKHTPLWEAVKNRSVKPIDDAVSAKMYKMAMEILPNGGFKQYEISNFAKDGFQCRHNLNYWENNSYTGLGASAVSYRDGVRSKNVPDIKEYIDRSEEGKSAVSSSEKLTPVRRAKETAALKIRTRDGINFGWFKDKTGYDFLDLEKGAVENLIRNDLIKLAKDKEGALKAVTLRQKGFLFCDTVSSALL